MSQVKFATAINCIDGRAQLPVIDYLKRKYEVDYIDDITDAAPAKVLAGRKNGIQLKAIRNRVKISMERHGSKHIAVVAHYDCAGNPVDKKTQIAQIKKSIKRIRSWEFNVTILGLWVDENWRVHEVEENQAYYNSY
jgi:hypothetical protein